jgi:hypothetical protein
MGGKLGLSVLLITILGAAETGMAQEYPAPKEGDWIAKDFRFHIGEDTPALRVHYTTIGAPAGEPVLVLHGTTMSGTAMLAANFAGELFGPGQALDASKYIVLPDSIGHGKSAKPFDWLRAKFPDDMVSAQYRLVTEGLSVRHLRMVLDNDSGVRGNARPPYHVVCEILEAASARSIADSAAKRLLAVPKVSDRIRAVFALWTFSPSAAFDRHGGCWG